MKTPEDVAAEIDQAYQNFAKGYAPMHPDHAIGNYLHFIAEGIKAARREGAERMRERCAKEAKAGGCSCYKAPCAHDEAGEVIAYRIRALPLEPEDNHG